MGCGGSAPEGPSFIEDDDWIVAGNDIAPDNKFPQSFSGYDNKEKLNLPCTDESSKAKCDVFYVHHTSLFGMKGDSMEDMRQEIECHVAVFNNCCRLYAPNYRAASNNTNLKQINQAYEDVKNAFLHFLKQWSESRPFFLAGSGQGSYLLLRLIREIVLDTDNLKERGADLRKRLVCAYLPGVPILESDIDKKSFFKASNNGRDIGSIVSWHTTVKSSHSAPLYWWYPSNERTWGDYTDDEKNDDKRYILVNPITFDSDTSGSSKENNGSMNKDGMLQPRIVGAKFSNGYKIIQVVVESKEYRPPKSDYMPFWMNIRQNAALRAGIWQNQQLM